MSLRHNQNEIAGNVFSTVVYCINYFLKYYEQVEYIENFVSAQS